MRIAVTGQAGQVVSCLAERAAASPEIEIVPVGRPHLDLAEPETIYPALAALRPDIVVSAAAYTAVQTAEEIPEAAFAINEAGACAVAEAAERLDVPVVHLSTDYVFDGTKGSPYVETDPTNPLNVYGASKLAGERAIQNANARHLILRTAWVYSPFGGNFVKTMLRLAGDRDEVSVVADQFGNPTSAFDIADAIFAVAPRLLAGSQADFGTYHLAGSGDTNWSGLAKRIFEISSDCGGPSATVREIRTADYPTGLSRPADSRLSSAKFEACFGHTLPHWSASIAEVVAELLRQRVQ